MKYIIITMIAITLLLSACSTETEDPTEVIDDPETGEPIVDDEPTDYTSEDILQDLADPDEDVEIGDMI